MTKYGHEPLGGTAKQLSESGALKLESDHLFFRFKKPWSVHKQGPKGWPWCEQIATGLPIATWLRQSESPRNYNQNRHEGFNKDQPDDGLPLNGNTKQIWSIYQNGNMGIGQTTSNETSPQLFKSTGSNLHIDLFAQFFRPLLWPICFRRPQQTLAEPSAWNWNVLPLWCRCSNVYILLACSLLKWRFPKSWGAPPVLIHVHRLLHDKPSICVDKSHEKKHMSPLQNPSIIPFPGWSKIDSLLSKSSMWYDPPTNHPPILFDSNPPTSPPTNHPLSPINSD